MLSIIERQTTTSCQFGASLFCACSRPSRQLAYIADGHCFFAEKGDHLADFMDVVFAEMAIACSGLPAVLIAEIHSVNLTPSACGLARASGLVTIFATTKMRCHHQRASEVKVGTGAGGLEDLSRRTRSAARKFVPDGNGHGRARKRDKFGRGQAAGSAKAAIDLIPIWLLSFGTGRN